MKCKIQEDSRFKINVSPFDPTLLKSDVSSIEDALNKTQSLIKEKKIDEGKALEVFINLVMSKGVVNNFLSNMAELVGPSIAKGYELKELYIDLPLKKDIFDGIEVMMGPKTSDEDKKQVEEMLKGIPNYQLCDSSLK